MLTRNLMAAAAVLFAAFGPTVPLQGGENQTADLTPIAPGAQLPFEIELKDAPFQLNSGTHSGVYARHKGQWLFLGGRTNGTHGFCIDGNNFPPRMQNYYIHVIDPQSQKTYSRSLNDPSSGLNTIQIDTLNVTCPQFYQTESTLYITGGYGFDRSNEIFTTKEVLTAVDIAKLIDWVIDGNNCSYSAADCIRQIEDPIFKVTGGYMNQCGDGPTLLVFGQSFDDIYYEFSNGYYTQHVRRFKIIDDGKLLAFESLDTLPAEPDVHYRRRDLNVVPFISGSDNDNYNVDLLALSGVFNLTDGAWTTPVRISPNGEPQKYDPADPKTLKQGVNNYNSALVTLFSHSSQDFFITLFGGITYGFFEKGEWKTDPMFPFTNQMITIQHDGEGAFHQYLMEKDFPVHYSTTANPGNRLLFGTAAQFVPVEGIPLLRNDILNYDALDVGTTLVGYIVGGIASTAPHTKQLGDSYASTRIFEVHLTKKR